MKVRDLVAQLSKFDPDEDVTIDLFHGPTVETSVPTKNWSDILAVVEIDGEVVIGRSTGYSRP
jgi:hypothetical protein